MGALIEQRPNGQTCVRSVLIISNRINTIWSLGKNTLSLENNEISTIESQKLNI